MTLEQIHEEVERVRNREFLWKLVALCTTVLCAFALRDARHEIKRSNVYREIAIDAMRSIPDPNDVDPIMLAIAQTDDAD